MSPQRSMPDEPPHVKTLLRAVQDQVSPELGALLERMCDHATLATYYLTTYYYNTFEVASRVAR